ncbi:hypothetical protein WA158_003180 [Blastocystis sp. Blastoise]
MCINPETDVPFAYGTYLSLYNIDTSLCTSLFEYQIVFKNYYCDQHGYKMKVIEKDPILCNSIPQLSSTSFGYYTLRISNIPLITIDNSLKQFIYNKVTLLPSTSPYSISSCLITRFQLLEYIANQYILEIDIQYTSTSLSNSMKSFLNRLFTSDYYLKQSLEIFLHLNHIIISMKHHHLIFEEKS